MSPPDPAPSSRPWVRRLRPRPPGPRLVVVTVLVTLLIGAVATGLALDRYRSARDAAYAEVAADADAQAADAGQFLAGRLAVLSVVAGEPDRLTDPASAGAVVANLLERLPDFRAAAVVDPDGTVRAGSGTREITGAADRRWLEAARAGEAVVVFADSPLFGGPVLVSAVPVAGDGGAVDAVLVAAQPGSWLNDITRSRQFEVPSEVFLVDLVSGEAIAAPTDDELGSVERWPALGEVRRLEPAASMLLVGGRGVDGAADAVVGVRRLVMADWAYVLQRRADALAGDARRDLWVSLAVVGTAALAAVVGSVAIGRRLDRFARRGRRVSLTLQRRLLPATVAEPACCTIAARYLPAASDLLVGGDWYESLELPDGRVVLAVGDVAGHGVDAASEMGTLRAQLAALAAVDPDPVWLLDQLARSAEPLGVGLVTLAYVLVDPAAGTVEVARAGHPPPILVNADGTAEAVWADGAALGVPGSPVGHVAQRSLSSVAAVVLYTDGLVERRGEAIDVGIERLRGAVAAASDAEPDELADRLLATLVGPGGADDDVAVVVARLDRAGRSSSIGTEGTGADVAPGGG